MLLFELPNLLNPMSANRGIQLLIALTVGVNCSHVFMGMSNASGLRRAALVSSTAHVPVGIIFGPVSRFASSVGVSSPFWKASPPCQSTTEHTRCRLQCVILIALVFFLVHHHTVNIPCTSFHLCPRWPLSTAAVDESV